MSGRKNLIMGFWSKLPFDGLTSFLASLRHIAFDGDVCIYVDDVSVELVEALLAHGVIVERASPSGQPHMTALSSRFFNFLDFLARHGDEYANVMISDLRDVIFQADPFATPLPAEIVYAQERCRLGDSPVNRVWVVQGYGEVMAHNMRDCFVSCAGTTFGTTSGIMRYLVAMTRELSGRPPPIVGGVDQGVHNYIVRMRPLRNAWCDTTDSIVATMYYVPDSAMRFTEHGVLIDGRLVPVIHQWDRKQALIDYIRTAPRFRVDATTRLRLPAAGAPIGTAPAAAAVTQRPRQSDAVICYYYRERDAGWLPLFLTSLRSAGFAGSVHCIGAFDQSETKLLSRHGCVAHGVASVDRSIVENAAHFHCSQMLDRLSADGMAQPDQVLVLDTVRAAFSHEPFANKTIGLSVFCEGPTRIGESEYNLHRLALFAPTDEIRLHQPIISSALLRGPLEMVRAFYRKLFVEFVGRAELLNLQKVIQGAINKLCHDGRLGFPVIVHPNASEVYFDFWASGLDIDMTGGVRIGGATPAIVLSASPDSELIRAIRINLDMQAA